MAQGPDWETELLALFPVHNSLNSFDEKGAGYSLAFREVFTMGRFLKMERGYWRKEKNRSEPRLLSAILFQHMSFWSGADWPITSHADAHNI